MNIKDYYIKTRVDQIDPDFLEYEEENINKVDKEKIIKLLELKSSSLDNPFNSILLYVTGLTDNFDFNKGRSDFMPGSPPDVDLDFINDEREHIFEWVKNKYGNDYTAQVGAYGTCGLLSLADDFARIHIPLEPKKAQFENESDFDIEYKEYQSTKKAINTSLEQIKNLIPEPVSGIAPTYEKFISDNLEGKNKTRTKIDVESLYPEFCAFAKYAMDMRKTESVHAAGIVISNEPVVELVPLWKNKDYERITQLDKIEVEELGLIKFDFLVVAAFETIRECLKLIKKRYNKIINLKEIHEGPVDPDAFNLLNELLLVGIFQMETSDSAKGLIKEIEPRTIEELSAITALNRPGPLKAGFAKEYIENKKSEFIPEDMPKCMKEILKDTYYVFIYQEQIMKIFAQLAGFEKKKVNKARKAIGKKDREVMNSLYEDFKKETMSRNKLSEEYVEHLWKQIVGFSEYGFNQSHSISYTIVTYLMMWLKVNYPIEFYTAFLSTKSENLAPEKYQKKIKEVLEELKFFDIKLINPDINKSFDEFTINENEIYYGLSGIKGFGKTSAKDVIKIRGNKPFTDIWDFAERINRSKLNLGKFEALISSGCFDKMGYKRKDLLDNKDKIYKYFSDKQAYEERLEEIKIRNKEREESIISGAKKKPALKEKEIPVKFDIPRYSKLSLTSQEIKTQAEYIGVYIGPHPTDAIGGERTKINRLWQGQEDYIIAVVTSIKEITDRNGDRMAFLKLEDSTMTAEFTALSFAWKKIKEKPTVGSIVRAKVSLESEQPIKGKILTLDVIKEV